MKVLLVGEFSKLHNNLQYGLKQLGVNVDTINTGDGFKKFNSDIKQLEISQDKKWDFIRKCYSDLLYTYIHNKYDVIQFVHEQELGAKYGLEKGLGATLAKNAKLSVLLQAGCNWQFFRNAKKRLGISPCEECLKYDVKRKYGCPVAHDNLARKTTYQLQKNVDVIVPMSYEYYMCNKNSEFSNKMVAHIPMPVIIDKQQKISKRLNDKLVIFHPLNREGFKGTQMIKKAFTVLKEKYSGIAEFIIDGKMSYNDYMTLVERTDILVDQKNGLTFGIASLEAMKDGKILITGNCRACIDMPQYNYIHEAPAFEIGTTVEEIVENISSVIDKRDEFESLRLRGKAYVEQYHDCKKVAQQFLELYERRLG